MKKSIIFFLSLFLIVFLACSESSSDDTTPMTDDNQGVVPENPQQLFPANFRATGSSANDILANTNFDRLRIQIAYVQSQRNFRPTDEAMNEFQAFLQQFTFKENIELVFTALESPDEEDLTLQEIADLEIENRTVYNDGTTLGIYIYFADAPSEGDDLDEGLVTLGAVYRNTSMVIYEETVRNLAGRSVLISNADVETATLNHEFGHLLGLVNLGSPAVNDHEDVDAENHCNVDPCLMRAQLEFGATNKSSIASTKEGRLHSSCTLDGLGLVKQMENSVSRGAAAAPDLDAECQLDLETNGGRPNTTG
ncbi:hypothetical protein MTsPCn9_28210 [Croceitalea sp. MTPC9]|uniref:hypothetical protein n=1 Tax=unclassified Croceitalea TaxID=2632280 RepID=UPI002B3C2777|nr:hypothetical protein MTsPCn6_21970 [Croceitalea sp. MTPC6]GMN17883.1 hypothetical protein MTsPCn9_28210 [Croceitalea sp. MTPC9]